MTVHTLNASPDAAAFADCLRVAAADDAIVLMGEAVYAVRRGTETFEQLISCSAKLYLLSEDANSLGMPVTNDALQAIDMAGLVQLCAEHGTQQAWY